ncbi:strawberry notch C-terminal domain-containing protein [Segatella copri]|uniref:Strawberry notch C-terminal domain-containing protein n=1 Tax=Segatella copri TaxID=165179 RepID=A0AAW4MY59_9BACT|nr:strawberry notch C-terminal domain-containing protein [Segatella copri]MBV3386838.1 strawberry notch C-terminal domain-containing protein [Segatella copri]MBV3394673.1 strawberry notch C-terminal domain-containing protein [Segatella copri]MBV3405235.1 strawberry notch C-terminal domain-containing protein [Segatella copri]
MTIDRNKLKQMHSLLAQNGYTQDYATFEKAFVGNSNYSNRKRVYDLFTQNGADIGKSYEDFMRRIQDKTQQKAKPVAQQKPKTMKQRAQEVAAQYRKPKHQPQRPQQPRTATASGTDYMQNWRLAHMRNDQMNPMQQAQASNMRARMQRAQEQSARQEQQRATPISRSRITSTAKNFNETMQQLSNPEAKQARAKQQREDDARAFAQYEVEGNKFVRNDGQSEGILGNDLLKLVDSSMNEAQELTRQQYQQNLDEKGGIYAPQSVKEQAFRDAQTQEQVNRQNVLMNNLSSKINEIYSQKGMQRHIAESAEKLNMSVEEYVDKYVTPEIMNYAQKALTMRNQEEIMPHGALDYIAKNLSNSIIGMVVSPSVMSRDTRQRLQEGIAIADGDAEIQKVAGHKDETYRSGIGTRFASTAVNMAADSGPLAVIGAGASAAVNTGTRVLTNGLVKAGVMKAAQKLTAQQMAFKVANMTTAQKIMSGLGTRTATGALNLAGYSGVTAALNQASTGDDTSLQAIGEAGLKGAEHGAVTGAMFGVSGAIMSPWVSKFEITGMEKSTGERLLHGTQKFGATAAGLGVEAGTMMVADNVTGDKDISFGTWLEDVVMVGAFKAGEPSNFVKMGNILHHLTHNSGGNFVIGKNANGSPIAVDIRLTADEKNELISSASGKNLMDAFVKVDRASKTAPRDPKYKTAYTDFMNDPDVSQSTKEKVNAAMGLFNTTRGKSYRSVNDVKNKQILEYTKNGTLLTRTSYKNADERRAILYKQKLYRDNDDMMSLMGYARMKDMQFIDDDGTVTNLAFRFLKENGYDENKDITDPNNARLIDELRNQKSALYLDWTKYADKNGLLGYLRSESKGYTNNFMASIKELLGKEGSIVIDIDKIMRKDPMKRTDEENRIFYHVKKALEDELFPSWRPHADQSASQGKTVAEEHSLGTDNPDSGVVVDELRNLRNAEQALDAAMDSNDVFKQTFERLHQQGLTPAQIYDALIQNGLTQEELTPLAQYINANARVQGMQQATADAIEENVKSFISDWSYHGTLNGQAMNGEQALYVQDSSGRTLLVGSGDVAFDQTTGRAKEGSGDMLVCLDPNTKELVYVKADEVTLFQNQPIDQFAAEYRQRLQMKNSEPYNQAAQEQAMLDAAKPQPKEQEAPQDNTPKSEDNTTKEGDLTKVDTTLTKVDTTLTKVDTTSGKDNTTNENLAPQEQPQPSRKFADGSDVPMTEDSKGRPTPDYEKMTPEQSAEILAEDFGDNAEKVVDGQIKKAENALKDAEKMKVDYTAEPNDIMEQETLKNQTIEAAKKQLDHAQNIKKAMTAKKVAETVGKTEQTEGAHEAGSVAAQKFVNAPRLVGNKRTRMLPDGETKIKGHYEIVPAESLTPSHDVNNGYKKSEGFPTDAEGRTVNDRDYEHDKAAQQNTDQIARKYNGMAIENVPVVSDEGIVYDGNGRTMAGQKAAKEGTDGEYINDLLENAENFGFTREQIEQSGIEHPRLVMVTDERLPYDAATFAKFNRNEKKTQSNTEQAVAKAKTLTSDEVGAIVAEIEGNGSLDAFFNNSKAINDLVKTLVEKGIIGQNEVAQMMDSPERLSAQGREYVKNLLLGSIFKPETIRMLGIDSTVKNKAINAIRSVMDNMKLGEFSLRDEIDQAIQLLYEARQGGNKVDTLLRTPDMFGENAAKRYSSISQMMALALEGKVSDFRDLLDEYNRIAKARNTGEGSIFEAAPTKEELINEYLNFKKWQDYGTGHSEIEGGNDVSGNEEPQQEASGGNEPAEAERPRVEEADDLENKELESRIEVTDEETETPSKNGPITRQKILIDGKKEVIKVDEPNDKGEYTGSYYKYDGKKFGDLNEITEYIDSKNEEGPLPLFPKEENPDPTFDPIAAAAAEFKKEHPLTEDEIMKADVDDLSKDMALDYLNGEVTDDLHRAIYESIFAKTRGQKTEPKVEAPKTEPSADPMEGIKNAAEGFEKEKKAKVETEKKPQQTADDAAVAASNKKVNDLWDMLKNAGKDEMSASFIGLNSRQLEVLPKLVSAMAENAYLRIKRGMHNLEDVVKEMRKEFAPAAKLFKKEDVDAIYEQMMNIRYRDGEQRMSLKDWADYYEKTSPKHQENLVGDSKTAEERKLAEKKFIDVVNLQLGFKHKFNGIVELRKIAERLGLKDIKDTDLQELAETAIVKRARGIASSESTNDAVKFERIKTLYENQPSLNQRDSERVMKQQYSTPAPYAFLADMYVKGKGKVIDSALEPSAGNGMLTIGLPMEKVHVNDIDAQRLANLRRQGFKNVTSQDGTQPFADKDVDVVVTNPPFGSATTRDYDGYKISSLEGQMAINALESMKDDGRAAIIIGGKTEYAKNGSLNPKDKAFLGYLYSHYNVEDVINVDGGLYAKQGTSYPTRIILINGRRLNENAFPPVKDKARAETVKDYDELYKRIEDDILRGERMDSSIGGETRSAQPELDKQGATGTPKERVRAGERGGSKPDGKRESDLFDSTSVSGTHDDLENQRGTEPRQDGGLPNGDSRTDGTGTDVARSEGTGNNSNSEGRVLESGGNGRSNAQPNADGASESGSGGGSRRQLQRMDQPVRGLSTEKVTYTPKSENPFTLKSVMPADQQEAVNKNLEKLGDADQFLVDELGYNDKDDLYSHLAAEQVDSVALALQQAKKGNAFIVGDQTGIGKGRQAASFIRYAVKNGQIPVYFTQKAHLLSDVYRDLVDIGSPELRPFILGSKKEATVTDSDGNVVYPKPSDAERDRVLAYIEKNGKLPKEYDYVLTTYSQVGNGVYEFDENGARKEKKLAKGKTFGAAALSGQRRRDAIEKLMGNAYLILDESHTAGGNSGQGNYFQHIIQKAKNVTFFSATFAKRPDNMPIYALRTAMNEGGMKSSDLIDAVKRGGATLQEIMSQTLTQCGQMIRRERDMTGVTIDWKAIDDPERVQEQREQYDSIIGLFNDIINFQKKYVSSYVDERNDELAAIQSTIGIKKGTAALGIKNQPFASKAFNTVQQVLLSLKAKSAAERAIDYLKQGMKPVIALNNTNESQTGNLALGEEMDAPDLGTSLKKGLEGTLRYTQKDAKDNSESGYIKLSDLGDEAVEAYHELEKKIELTSTGLSLSPIDVIKNELQKAGYKVGELTGRQTEFVYNDNGTVTKVKRADTDKKKLARDFNDGKIDALILNKSAATGISLHASSKYKDQKKRVMIVAQQQLDVNDEVQMRGRIDRTGQVARGAYEYVVSLIPAEQRLLMMFKAKLKSLDANTTSSQKSKFNEMEVADITNKYGDKVVREYMAEHLDLYARMADPFGWEKSNGDDLSRIDPQTLVASGGGVGDGEAGADASKLLGRMALLRVNEQEKMLQEIGELYANEIQRLNEMGENDLEITELPLKAKTLHKEVWKQGAEPGGDNAFADNTYIEKVNMAILKKPMKASEVKASQEGLTGGKTWDEYKTEKKAAVKEYFDQKIANETQKYEERAVKAATKAKEKYIKDAKKGQKDSGMSDEQIEKMAGYQYDNIYKQEKDKLNDVVKNLKAKAEMFERVLDTFDTNGAFVLPMDMNNPNELSGFGNSYGRLIDIKITDNYSPNASSVSFATLDGRRKITFPIAGKVGSGENKVDIIGSIDNMTKQAAGMGDSHLRVLNQNFDNWDRLTSNESRKDGYIVTGNLMQALVDSKDQGLGGQLVKYTTDTGEVKTGILMPDRFDPKGLTTDAPINSVAEKFELSSWHGGIDEVTSSDGEVKVKRVDNNRGYYYELRVPKSKAKGGKYFMDNDLLKLVDGNNFETRGNSMLAEFKPEQLKPVLDRLSKMGVKVQEERKTSEDEGTHFREDRGLQYSKTDTKDVKNSRIIPEDVDKNVSSQIEKKFDSAIEDIVEHAEDRDKSRLVDDADYAVEEFSNLGRSVIEYYRNDYERKVEKLSGLSTGGRNGGNQDSKGNRGSYLLQYYKTILAVADRELAYRDARAKNLRETWGLQPGGTFLLGDVERIFKETNRDKEKAKLFQKVLDINKRLGVNIKVSAESPKKRSGEADIYRNIDLYIDGLTKTKAPDYAAPTIMLHEMIHEVTMGAINLVKKGKAEGMLTPKQIEGVKTILEIYDKVTDDKERFKEEPYGLSDAYELTAQMADSRQRKAMDLSIWDKVVNAAREFARKGDRSIMQRLKDAWKKLFEVSEKDKMDKAINDIMDDFNETIDDISMNDIEQDGFAYKVTDKDELDRLNKEKTFRMYSGMQEVDGKLYSPMAAIIDGKRTDATEIGAWMGADERPDLVKNGKFTLVKTDKNKGVGEGDVPAAYNPYMHTSTSMMNDQFTGAYARGNIKVVEWEIPESEKTSGYHAEGAKDAVGLVPWHSGSVNSLLPKDRQRQVMLSRWRKAVRVVPDSEVAESIAEQLKGTGLAIPWNVVTPNQVRELAKLGVPITTVESGRQAPETKEKFLQQMAELEQEFPQAKFVNVKMTKDAYKEWGKDGGTKFRTDNSESNYPTSSVESHIEKVAQKTGAKVNMVSSVDEITNKAAKAAIEEGRKITGWYDEKTGEVHLYMPNIHDRYTAEKTIWHEVVEHKGMRELFGDERFDKFLREVWYDLDKPENAALKKLVDEERKFNPLNIYDAIEEGIARLAEDGKGEAGFWNGIKNKVSDFLHEIGYRIAPNTKDVKYLLWLSKNLQKNPNDPYWKLRAEAVKYRLDHERMPAVVAHDGMFYGNDGKVRSMDNLTKAEWNEATDGEIHFRTTPSAGTALDRYHRSLDEHGYMFTESYMDNMLSLKKLMNAIVPDKKIEDIASSENPYILQNTMQGAMSDAAQMFERNVMKPLDKAMAGVLDAFDGKKDDEKIRNFNLYMITKHGLERNRILYVRDALKYMRMNEKTKKLADTVEFDWNNEKATLDEKLERGDIDLKTYYERMDDFIRTYVDSDNKFDAGEHDYSGIHAIQEVAKSSDPYDDAEAIASVMDSEAKMESIKKGSVKDYWDKVKAATQYSIDTDYKNGLISRELYGHVSDMFNWYVPLRKYDEATAEDTYGYITEQGDPKSYIGSTIMRARGHKYLSETNVLAQIGAMGNRAIKNGGMNAIRQAFARFVRNNSNNNLVTETRVWYADDPITHTTVERYPDIPDGATADEINQIVADFNMEMKDLESKGLATKVYRRGRIGYKFQRAENKSQHIVDVKIAGRTHSFIINGNPRAAQALNGLLEHKNDTLAGRVTASISRKMAQLCTSFNPEFVMRNMIKDFEFASTNLLAKEGLVYTKRFEQYYAKVGIIEGIRNSKLKDFADTGGFGLYAKYRNGTLDTTNKLHRYFKEFMENGGETGWVQIKNMEDFTKEYKLHIKGERKKAQKVGKGIYNAIFKNLENVNEIAENLARFATYCASRDSNRSIIRSVYDAKEVSTNFNRHGSGNAVYSFKNGEMGNSKTARRNIYGFTAAWFRNSSMFFNAGIQSTNLLIKNFKNNKAGTIGYIASAPFISGMAMALLNNFIISNEDEKDRKGVKDPYAELPDYIRRNNLCIYIGGGEFVTIPLAIEERAFYGLGDFAAGMTFSKNISSQKMPNLTENKDIDKYLNPFMDAVGCMSQLVPVADYLGNASFGKHPVQETIKAVAPSATSPFLEWMYNSDWKGAPIQRDNKFDENQPSWMLAYKGTPEWMINMNKKVNALTNDVAPGNEDMKGNDFLDEVTNPSALHHFYGSYLGGAATFVERVAGLIKNGKNTETKDIPFVRSLLYTPNEQSSLQRTKSKWYNYKDEMEKTMANVDRLKSKNVPLDKRISNIGEYFHFQNSKEAAKVRIIELAEKQMDQWKKMKGKASDTESINFANQNIDRIMMEAVNDLDKLN